MVNISSHIVGSRLVKRRLLDRSHSKPVCDRATASLSPTARRMQLLKQLQPVRGSVRLRRKPNEGHQTKRVGGLNTLLMSSSSNSVNVSVFILTARKLSEFLRKPQTSSEVRKHDDRESDSLSSLFLIS